MESENEKSIQAAATLIKVLFGCFATSTIFISALPWLGVLRVDSSNLQSNPNLAGLTQIFYVIAAVAAVSGILLKKFLLKTAGAKQNPSVNFKLKIFNMAHLLAFACFEAIAIFGLVNYFLTADQNSSLIFGVASIACMIASWPKELQLREFLKANSFTK